MDKRPQGKGQKETNMVERGTEIVPSLKALGEEIQKDKNNEQYTRPGNTFFSSVPATLLPKTSFVEF